MPDRDFQRSRKSGLRAAWPWLFLVGAFALWAASSGSRSGPLAGEPAPALRVPWTSSEEPFDLAEQRGHVTVLAFWATWCPACRSEGPVLSRVQQRIREHGDAVVGVSIDDAPLAAIARTARDLGMAYPIAKGSRADTDRFGVELLPTIVVVAPDGRVSESFAGTVGERRLLEAVGAARTMR